MDRARRGQADGHPSLLFELEAICAKVDFLSDGNGEFAKAIDLTLDLTGAGMGTRSKRYSMLVEDGVVKKLNLEPAPGKVEVSGGDTLLAQL